MTRAQDLFAACRSAVGKVIVGQDNAVRLLVLALLTEGHVLLEGVPGVAKTTLVKAFSRTLGCRFKRIQFTPDLLPSDITGTYILDMRENTFVLRRGPIFAQVVLGDEINRAPAKTQSALLEAMQERQVTIEGETQALTPPFMVLATQNPVEQEGTYPLPEAQVDRFMVKISLDYPTADAELGMLSAYNQPLPEIDVIASPEQILEIQRLADEVFVDSELLQYVLDLVTFTRKHRRVFLGASPRASLNLVYAAKALALIDGRGYVVPDDIKALAPYVLAHRLILTPEAELDGLSARSIVGEALEKVPHRPGRGR